MALLMPILGAVGAGASALGTIEGGMATSAQAGYQAHVAYNNSVIANQNAAHAAAAGSQQATDTSMRNAAAVGRIKAAQGANNIDVNTGSAVEVQTSQREVGELSSLTAENNALLQAYGYRAAASSYGAEAGLEAGKAAQAPVGAAIGAAGGLLGNASALSDKWLNYNWNPTSNGNLPGSGSDSGMPGPGTGGLY